jgi:hypothetical protein
MRLVFRKDDELHVFRLGPTTNKKICENSKEKIVQTYVFSIDQYEYVLNGGREQKVFFEVANANCIDCPMRGYGDCYTHKYTQARGFFSMLKSIANIYSDWDSIPKYTRSIHEELILMAVDKYVRFGTYGEPVLHGSKLVADMVEVAKSWTGYTHQWHKYPEFSDVFMASVHSPAMEQKARSKDWKSFVTLSSPTKEFVNCPASKEADFKTSCDKCGLCSGTEGKGKKSIYILEH